MKRSAIIFFILISFIGGIIWYGNTLPELSHISASKNFNSTADDIWQLIFEFERYPEWRENVYAVEKIPHKTQHDAWKEINEDGVTTTFQLVEFNPGSYIIMQETSDTHKSSGKWRFEVEKSKDAKTTTLTINEDRLFPELLPRVINHLLNTSTVSIDAYFRSIDNKINGDVIRLNKTKLEMPDKN